MWYSFNRPICQDGGVQVQKRGEETWKGTPTIDGLVTEFHDAIKCICDAACYCDISDDE